MGRRVTAKSSVGKMEGKEGQQRCSAARGLGRGAVREVEGRRRCGGVAWEVAVRLAGRHWSGGVGRQMIGTAEAGQGEAVGTGGGAGGAL